MKGKMWPGYLKYSGLLYIRSMRAIINISEALDLMGKGTVHFIDCRFQLTDASWGDNQYSQGHIPGAVYAHLDRDLSSPHIPGETGRHPLPDPLDFSRKLRDWGVNSGDRIIVYDQGPGGYGARCWWLCRWVGIDKVQVLNGGYKAWIEASNPMEKGEEQKLSKGNFRPRVRDWMTAEPAIRTEGNSAANTIVDAREHKRYLGEEEPIDPVAGHIPGAVNIPFQENLNEKGEFKSPEELKKRYQNLDAPLFYCGSGVTACHNILAMKDAGLGMGLLYPGSWSHWITDPSRPIVTGSE